MSVVVEAQSYEQRLERLLSWADHQPLYLSRGREAPHDPVHDNVVIMTERPEGPSCFLREWQYNANLVTNHGDEYYALRGAVGTPAAGSGASRMELANPGTMIVPAKGNTYASLTSAITASRKVFDTGYPKVNDDDTNNPGRGTKVVTYRVTWQGADFNALGIKNGAIHDHATSPVNIISLFKVEPAKDKASTDTMTVWVNHSMLGA